MTIEQVQARIEEVFVGDHFKFDPERHRYTLDGQYLPSVTGLTKRWKKPFDREGIGARVAKRDGRPVADVLAEWDAKGKKAAELGTEVHALIEDYWAGKPPPGASGKFVSEEAKRRFAAFLDFRQKKLPNLVTVGQEIRIFSRKYKTAGTLDFLGYNNRDGKLYIFDWKTNSKFRTDNDRAFDKLLSPFEDMDDNEHNVYSIQLSLYKLFLKEEADIDIAGCMLVHIPAGGANAQLYPAKDLTKQIEDALRPTMLRAGGVEF